MSDRYPYDWNSRRQRILHRDSYTCQNCGAEGGIRGNTELHVHHSVPISKGGTHRISNLLTHCKDCHDAIHGNKMAPTATHNRRQQTPLNEVEFPTFTETLLTMMWWGAFLLGTSAHPALGLLVIGVWLRYKYKTWDSGEAIEPSQGSEYIIMQSIPLSDRDSIDDGVSSDAPQDSHTWRETGSESSDGPHEPGFTATTDDDHVATTEEQVPFDWYGDEDVPVQTVLDHIDTELDPETRHQIIRSVEKHRARGDAVDAADIRWVAEASEKLDLEGEHPF